MNADENTMLIGVCLRSSAAYKMRSQSGLGQAETCPVRASLGCTKPEAYPTEPDEESMTCGRIFGQEAERRGLAPTSECSRSPAGTGCEWAKG